MEKPPRMIISDDDIRLETKGALGLITLQREEAMNAVTLDMLRKIRSALDVWEKDNDVKTVAIRSSSPKFFSAGGDIKAIYDGGRETPFYSYFAEEYQINARIHAFPKPYVALIDGLVMGGGAGVSVNGSHRVLGPGAKFAMPEVSIGFFPDAGGTYNLSRMPGTLGLYCGLTGARLNAADCFHAGIGTRHGGDHSFDDITGLLAEGREIESVVYGPDADTFKSSATLTPDMLAETDTLFSGETLREIVDRVGMADTPFAEKCRNTLSAHCPSSLAIAFRQIRLGRDLSFNECMALEFRILNRILQTDDFYEGIRAAVIDKDRNPKWSKASLAEIDDAETDRFFAALGPGRELFDLVTGV